MLTEGVKVSIGGKELNLVLNTEAMAQIADQYGDLNAVHDRLNDAPYSEKIRLIPSLIALLATQGEEIKGTGEVITPKFITCHTMPKDILELRNAFLQAVSIGMNIQMPAEEGETDEVLAQIQKNVQSGAAD